MLWQAGHTPGTGSLIIADAAAQPVAAGEVGEGHVAVRAGPGVATVARPAATRSRAGSGTGSPCRRPRSAWVMARESCGERTPCTSRRSTISRGGGAEPSTRCGRSTWRDIRERLDAGRGRAEHERGAARPRPPGGHRAGVVARFVLLLVGGVVLLVDDDEAEVAMGAKTADRAPSTRRARPSATSRQAARRSPAERPEWNTAIRSLGKRLARRPMVCPVRPISGTSTSTPCPERSTASAARR